MRDYEANSPTVRTFWNVVDTRLTDDEKWRFVVFHYGIPTVTDQ
jgi:hypothetical protein